MNTKINKLKGMFKNNRDVIFKQDKYKDIYLIFQEDLCDYKLFLRDFYQRIDIKKFPSLTDTFPGLCKVIPEDENFYDRVSQLVFTGLMVCYYNFEFYLLDLSIAPTRNVSDSLAEPDSMFDSRDGFVEGYKKNIAIIRTRVKSTNLRIKEFMVGKRSKTYVGVFYIEDIHNPKHLTKLSSIISKIDVDAVLSIEDITSYLQRKNLFPTYIYVGSPDLAVRKLYEGELLILIDRVPTVIAFPTSINLSTRFRIDNINTPIFTFLERIFILFAIFMSTIFLGLLTSFVTYQSNCLSLVMVTSLNLSERGVFFPIYLEILIVLALFELCYLIGFRQSKITLSSTVVMIAGLIIGENMVNSGLVGVMLMSLSALAFLNSFIVSSNITMLFSISIIRLLLLFCSVYFGLFGLIIGICYLAYRFFQEDPIGVSYFYPFLPFDIRNVSRFFFSSSKLKNTTRAKTMKTIDKTKKRVDNNA